MDGHHQSKIFIGIKDHPLFLDSHVRMDDDTTHSSHSIFCG